MHFNKLIVLILFVFTVAGCQKTPASDSNDGQKLKALIIDGQNNHGIWPKTTMMMKSYLEQTGLFEVDVERTAFTWQGPHNDNDPGLGEEKRKKLLEEFPLENPKATTPTDQPQRDTEFKPDFSGYDVVISNFGWTAAPWPTETQKALEEFVSEGGGLVVVHAANNSFPEWLEYNKMIGVGGWGNRSEKDGPYVYFTSDNSLVRDTVKGPSGSHGKQYEFSIIVRNSTHPITQGMPSEWLHVQDELYDRLRGPAENMEVLATAYSDEEKNASPFSPLRGTSRHEPMLMTIEYGKGRVFQTPLGHADYSMECVGFITLFQRAAEWTATGKVTQKIPADFPTAEKTSQRKWTGK